MALTAWDEQQNYRDYLASLAYNGARSGRSLHRILSKGAGQTHLVTPTPFTLTFVEQPTFTSGVSLAGGKLTDGAYPIVTVGVYRWHIDTRGFYVGAYLWFGVSTAPTAVSPVGDYNFAATAVQLAQLQQSGGSTQAVEVAQLALQRAQALNELQLEHHLSFEGLALRDIDYDRVMND